MLEQIQETKAQHFVQEFLYKARAESVATNKRDLEIAKKMFEIEKKKLELKKLEMLLEAQKKSSESTKSAHATFVVATTAVLLCILTVVLVCASIYLLLSGREDLGSILIAVSTVIPAIITFAVTGYINIKAKNEQLCLTNCMNNKAKDKQLCIAKIKDTLHIEKKMSAEEAQSLIIDSGHTSGLS